MKSRDGTAIFGNEEKRMKALDLKPGIVAAKLFAFLKRDFIEESSYRFNFLASFAGIFISSATMFFISRLITKGEHPSLTPYGGDYFAFVIIGIAFSGILEIFHQGLPDVIRNAQVTGTLESLLVTQTGVVTILVGSSLYTFLVSFIRTVFHLILAIAVFGMILGTVNWPGAVLVFFLTAVCFLSIGILSASFILVYKLGNPFHWVFGSVSGLLGGVFFPIAILPDWLRWISHILPVTHSLQGLRLSLLSSVPFSQIWPSVLALIGFSVVLLPLSLIAFRISLKKAKKDGSLTHY